MAQLRSCSPSAQRPGGLASLIQQLAKVLQSLTQRAGASAPGYGGAPAVAGRTGFCPQSSFGPAIGSASSAATLSGMAAGGRAQDAFISQIFGANNPDALADTKNCGPAAVAMALAYSGRMPPGLTKEQQIDYARALMSPGREGELTYVRAANGQSVPQLDRDLETSDLGMVANGLIAGGGAGFQGSGFDQLDAQLAKGPAVAYGNLQSAWRANFPGGLPGADTRHIITVMGKTADGRYIVADPMHQGGPVTMTREQLSTFFQESAGVPTFFGM